MVRRRVSVKTWTNVKHRVVEGNLNVLCVPASQRVIVAKRPSPCCYGRGVTRTGGVYLKPTAVLPRSPGNEIQPPHS